MNSGEIVHFHSDNNNAEHPKVVLPSGDEGVYDVGCASVGTNLYMFGVYEDLNTVTMKMQYYNLTTNTWHESTSLPENAAESHTTTTQDDYYFYMLPGQWGSQCMPPVKNLFVFDRHAQTWTKIPSLSVARYGGCTGDNQLHFMVGFDSDRRMPMPDHFSTSMKKLHKQRANLEKGKGYSKLYWP